jgi:lysophospholipase L1-like esterase
LLALLSLAALVPGADPLALKDGDRVVWIGSTVAEREQRYGHWETALLCRFPGQRISVRNLGWSGDTVAGTARLGFDFDKPAEGFKRLVSLTLELKPTVIFVSYGTNESFAGPAGVPEFERGLERLLDALAPSKARVVLFTPRPFEPAPPLLDPTERNRVLDLYARAVRDVADRRGHRTADLFDAASRHQSKGGGSRFTDNGMHLSDAGYEGTIPEFLSALGLTWAGEDPARYEAIRAAVRKKNELFFHRWRPQNETYLFGFRKHEQGKNAKEVAEFDPLVAAAEGELFKLLTAK